MVRSPQFEGMLDIADLLDRVPLEEIIDLLRRSRRIALFGINPNLSLAELFKRKMQTIGRGVETPALRNIGLR